MFPGGGGDLHCPCPDFRRLTGSGDPDGDRDLLRLSFLTDFRFRSFCFGVGLRVKLRLDADRLRDRVDRDKLRLLKEESTAQNPITDT